MFGAFKAGAGAVVKTGLKTGGGELVEKVAIKGAGVTLKEATQKASQESLQQFFQKTAQKTVLASGKNTASAGTKAVTKAGTIAVAEAGAKAGTKAGTKVVAETLESAAKNAGKEFAGVAKKSIGESMQAAAKSAENLVKGVGVTMVKHPKMVALGITAVALGAAALAFFIEKNNFQLKIVKMTKKNSSINQLTNAIGLTDDKSDILVMDVAPVEGNMIDLVAGAAIEVVSSSTTPSMGGYTLDIVKVLTKTSIEVKLSKIPNYEKMIINEPISGIVKYKTGVGLEALKIFEDTTKTVVDSALGSADGISNFLANALGIDPDLFKILVIIVCIIAAYILFLRPFISAVSMFIPTGIGIGGGGCDKKMG